MSNENDLLSADKSPSTLDSSGVKRVNNFPLFLVIGALTLFSLLIGMVAIKRANAQSQPPKTIKTKAVKKDTMRMAREVVLARRTKKIAIPEVKSKPAEYVPLPALPEVVDTTNQIREKEHVSDAEFERIRQEKAQLFEEAVKAKSSILMNRQGSNASKVSQGVSQSFGLSPNDVAGTFKEQLQLLQSAQKSRVKPNARVLGGAENDSRWELKTGLQSPTSTYELRAGAVIPGVMISGVRSELPGQIIGQVSQDVYDTATGKYLLIPQGTKLMGLYSSDVGFGQDSVLIAWQRLIMPDGKALDIGSMPGADSAGYAGFRDKVNHHYISIYGSALLMSGIVAGISYSQQAAQPKGMLSSQPTVGSTISQSVGQQLGEVTSQLVSKNLNVSPTVTVSPGYRFNIIVVKDLVFKRPYEQFAY